MRRLANFAATSLVWLVFVTAARSAPPLPRVPEGFEIEIAAKEPIVERPVMACFDDRGRLWVVDSAGVNEPYEKLLKNSPHRIVVIEDTNGDGVFDYRTVFADKLVMPQGVLPYQGAVYTASPPSVWKLEDTDGDGVCDKRTEIVTEFGSNGNAADIHGPFLGPDGWLYLCDGRHGHKVTLADGMVDQGLAGGIFRFRPDGSHFERVCGGGFDNPVEIDFTEAGEILGTVNILHGNPRQDCLMHWVEGGVYPRADQEPCLAEFKRTGDLLPAVKEFGHVAVSGMTRYRSGAFGPEYRDNLFITFFNRHQVIRTIVERDGATFSARDEEFLVSNEKDFHPTDVLEDADGSLLVVDTGGWFRIGCPVSEIAKPEVFGAIYRIRRKGASRSADPRGLAIELADRPIADVASYLDDERESVQLRAVELLTASGRAGVVALAKSLSRTRAGDSAQVRRNAAAALARISDAEARAALLRAARDEDETVRLVAIRGLGMAAGTVKGEADAEAAATLLTVVVKETPAVRREAATALGRLFRFGTAGAKSGLKEKTVTALLESVRAGVIDRILEHALIYALIRIDAPEPTASFLRDSHPRVRQAALIALDQMDHGNLTREQVTPLLDTDDASLRRTALSVVAARKGWATELVELLRSWLYEPQPDAGHLALARGVLLAQAGDPAIQTLIGDTLAADQATGPVRLLLWEVVSRASIEKLPDAWLAQAGKSLGAGSPSEQEQVVALVSERGLAQFDERLAQIADDRQASAALRVAALAALAPRLAQLGEPRFVLLAEQLGTEADPLLMLSAARALATAPLSKAQLLQLAEALPAAGPLAAPALVRAFEKSNDERVGLALVAALDRSAAAESLSAGELARLLARFSGRVTQAAEPLLKKLGGEDLSKQKSRLKELAGLLDPPGDAKRGRDVFFARKAGCANCHSVGSEGGRIGPDLTKIGASRAGVDLLEAVVFPSASFAREFRPYTILTDTGKTQTGVISRQTVDAIYLRTADLAEIRLPRASVEEMKESNTSIMPKGLDTLLTPGELRDLLAYLQGLR